MKLANLIIPYSLLLFVNLSTSSELRTTLYSSLLVSLSKFKSSLRGFATSNTNTTGILVPMIVATGVYNEAVLTVDGADFFQASGFSFSNILQIKLIVSYVLFPTLTVSLSGSCNTSSPLNVPNRVSPFFLPFPLKSIS